MNLSMRHHYRVLKLTLTLVSILALLSFGLIAHLSLELTPNSSWVYQTFLTLGGCVTLLVFFWGVISVGMMD
jgi:hypothetical protein